MAEKKITSKNVQPSFAYLIEKKREAEEFTDSEVRYIVESILKEKIPSHQLAALIMAIYFQGLSAQETAVMSDEMMLSGEVVDLTDMGASKISLYSTGGVGNKAGMVLTPLVASCGVVVPSVIGEDENFIFGDLKKLQAIPGFKTELSVKECVQQLKKVGCCFCARPKQIAPVDQMLNKMRQETATIASIPLITSSILSKRLAIGSENLVVDVKWGNGSFIKDLEQAKQLARVITRVARSLQRRCVALVTDANQPIGDSVGTSLEIQEVIELLQGRGTDENAKDLVLKLGMEMVRLAGVSGSTLAAKQTVLRHLNDGSALAKFKEMVKAQGGDSSYIDHPEKFGKAKYVRKLAAPKRGYIHAINAGMLAKGVDILMHPTDSGPIDTTVGITQLRKVGTQVKQGDALMMIHYNDHSRLDTALEYLKSAYRLAPKRPTYVDFFVERVA